ncbi:uncharacterized protein V6R79_015123 [Siganus canaliculatus]
MQSVPVTVPKQICSDLQNPDGIAYSAPLTSNAASCGRLGAACTECVYVTLVWAGLVWAPVTSHRDQFRFPGTQNQRLICAKPRSLNPSQTLVNALGMGPH